MILLNFSHPLTAEQLAQVEALAHEAVERVIEVPVQVDLDRRLDEQVVAIVDRAGLETEEWQTLPLLVNPPGYAPAAAAVLAEIDGRAGHLPALLWLRLVEEAPLPCFEVAQTVNLEAVRARARRTRFANSQENEG